jgi:hypothetical protein
LGLTVNYRYRIVEILKLVQGYRNEDIKKGKPNILESTF